MPTVWGLSTIFPPALYGFFGCAGSPEGEFLWPPNLGNVVQGFSPAPK